MYENFRIAIESRDQLPTPEQLKIKILEEGEARNQINKDSEDDNALYVRGNRNKSQKEYRPSTSSEKFKFKCHRCRKYGHKAAECRKKEEAAQIATSVKCYSSTTQPNPSVLQY